MSLPIQGFQLHFVGKGFLGRKQVLPVEVAIHHSNDGLIAIKIHDVGRNAIQFQPFAGVVAAVTADDFKIVGLAAVLLADGTDGDGRKNPVLTDALHQSCHFFIITDTERMILHRADAVETDGVISSKSQIISVTVKHA